MLEPGDLIEIERGTYQHWAMYAGEGYLIHFTVEGDEGVFNQLADCVGTIRKDKFNDVVGDCRWNQNNTMDETYKPKSPAEYLKEAEKMVGRKKKYNLTEYNCEHFVTDLRYGDPKSKQVDRLGSAARSGLGVLVSAAHVSRTSNIS